MRGRGASASRMDDAQAAWLRSVSFSDSIDPMTWARSRCVGGLDGTASSAPRVSVKDSNSLRHSPQAAMWARTLSAVSVSSFASANSIMCSRQDWQFM